jgi:small conductance mechanosensitive channel
MQIFKTILNTPDNIRVICPNAQLTGGNIMNYTVNGTRRIDLVIGVSYEDDVRQAKQVIEGVLAGDERVLQEPAPTVAVYELGDSSVNFVVRPWVKSADYWDAYFDITAKVKLALDENGISIPYPQRDVHIKNGNLQGAKAI